MDLRKLKNKFLEANAITDDIKVIFRLPDCKSYDDCHCHIVNITSNNVLVIDLIDKIEPKFKVGDIVTNSSGLYPNVKCTITTVDKEKQCYYFREVSGVTYFKDQDKLMLVKEGEVRPPVEGDIKLSLDATITKQNVQIYNHNNYNQFSLIDKFINEHSKMGYNSYIAMFSTTVNHHDKNGKILVLSDLIDRIVNHYISLGFSVCVDKDDYNYKVLIKW